MLMRGKAPEPVSGHRLLMISNQVGPDWYASFSETFNAMVGAGELEAFQQVFPGITMAERGHAESLEELLRAAERSGRASCWS